MGLNIKNSDVERLAAEVAGLTGESKTQAIRVALLERKSRLSRGAVVPDQKAGAARFLEREVWPLVPEQERGRRMSKRKREAILGYSREGV